MCRSLRDGYESKVVRPAAAPRTGRRGTGVVAVCCALLAAGCGRASDAVPDGQQLATDDSRPAVSAPPRQSTTTTTEELTSTSSPPPTTGTTSDGVSAPPTSGGTGPSQTTSTTLMPPTSSSPPAVTSPPGSNPVGTAALSDVRAARNEGGFDRVVFQFGDLGPASYSVEYVERPVLADASGEAVTVAGDSVIRVRMTSASGAGSYSGPSRLDPGAAFGTKLVEEMVRTGDFEAQLTWVIGVKGRPTYTVANLATPSRIVIDLRG
jgi:hypothetical protein